MAKPRITQTIPHDSPGSLVFWCQRYYRTTSILRPFFRDNLGKPAPERQNHSWF